MAMPATLTATKLIGVVRAVHVVVTLLVLADARAVGTAELVGSTADCKEVKQVWKIVCLFHTMV